MVTVMLMMVFLALVGLGLGAYAHSLLTDAVGQAARMAANSDVNDPQAISARASDIMAGTLAASAAGTVACDPPQLQGQLVEVRCTMAAPGVLPFFVGVLPDVEATAHALREVA
jgi:Flp pilus assembly protein TadG